MAEQIVHSVLLALHNIALVGCAAAPFYNRQLVLKRGQYGPRLHYELDKVVEDALQQNAPYCLVFLTTLWITGVGMPLNHFYFHGAVKELHLVAVIVLALKLLAVVGMMVIMFVIFFQLNPRLRDLFASFSPGDTPDPEKEKEFFEKRTRRKGLCEICLKFAVAVLVSSAFLGFGA